MPEINPAVKPAAKPAPQRSLLRRIFGEPLSQNTAKQWPELEKQWAGRQIEMPNEEGKVTSLGTMNMFDKFRYPDTFGVTGPFGGIKLNRELIEKENADVGDILVHEMTHAGQGSGGFLKRLVNPKLGNELENQAINKEALRKVRKHDIELRPEQPVIKFK